VRTFNAHHAPIGAYATFTLGGAGRAGGLRCGSGHPPRQDVWVGIVGEDGVLTALPFFADGSAVRPLPLDRVQREFRVTSDAFSAGALTLRIRSPLGPVPEPGVAGEPELRDGLLPAVLLELELDNRDGVTPLRAMLGVRPGFPVHARADGIVIEDSAGRLAGLFGAPGDHLDGGGVLRLQAAPGERARHRLVAAFWHGGTVASGPGIECSYWYTTLFDGLGAVVRHAFAHFDRLLRAWDAAAAEVEAAPLSDDQRFQLAHAIHSYYGNTALLRRDDGRPLWAVMEGEFEFVNTLDLAVDMAFFELRQSPWTVRNVLEAYVERGAYRDRHGLSFAHDLGCFPAFSLPGGSAYEQPRRPGRTVLMTSEELTNWLLAARMYVAQTGDTAWATAQRETFAAALASIAARDRDGLVSAETELTGPYGDEITTFDALDPSLRRARHSGYLAGKQWAALAAPGGAREQAGAIAERLVAAVAEHGHVPGRLAGDGEAADLTYDLPVLECLALALYAGADLPAALVHALRRHLAAVLQPGRCLFPDGGWKLSAAHHNSWLSKVYLCQFVARRVLGLRWDEAGRRADAAHAAWLTNPDDSAWAFSDQFLAGRVHNSRYYPRGVTAALWLEEHRATAKLKPLP
jgi:hypothetical protein